MSHWPTEMRLNKQRDVYAHGWRQVADGLYFCYWYGRLMGSAYYANSGRWLIIRRREDLILGMQTTCFMADNPPYAVEHLEGP